MRFTLISCMIIFALTAKADSIAYEVASSRDFGTVDLNTGVYTEKGQTPNVPISGLGEFGGTLYAAGSDANTTLYVVNAATGGFTAIGTGTSSSGRYGDSGSTTTGLYDVGSNTVNGITTVVLWSINPVTGVATLVGPTGTGLGGASSLSVGSNALYFTNGASLYMLNTTTGNATLIGTSAVSFQAAATVFENGTLYGALDSPCCSFYTINTTTASASALSNETNGPLGGIISALAPFPASAAPVPEPSCLGVLGSALLGLGVFLQKRRK